MYIKGNYTRSIYTGNNGYTVGLFRLKETDSEEFEDYVGSIVTFTGYFDTLSSNDTYKFYGNILYHSKYGMQFEVTSYEVLKPTDKLGIETFLSSDLFPGIGSAIAKKIVDKLGEKALDLILDNPSVLDDIKISAKKKMTIITNLVKYDESHKIIVYLTDIGFNMKEAIDIYNLYKDYAIEQSSKNIYEFIDSIGIPFPKIDMIAIKMGYKKDDPRRILKCIIYNMKNLVFETGNTYLYKEDIYNITKTYLKNDIPNFSDYLSNLEDRLEIIKEDDRYYLKDMYDDEQYIVSKLKKLNNTYKVNLKAMDTYSPAGIKYNEEQIRAIKSSISGGITIITGGPGTGKTTIIKAIVDMYSKLYNKDLSKVALIAPTGRAAKRMSESCIMPSSTIHRFLKWNKDDNTFNVNEFNKDTHDMIIIDEVSMVDLNLFASLLRGLNDNVKLVLVGDYNQLPSVGPGNILKDLIDSDMFTTIYLEKLYRQSDESYIPTLASDIKNNMVSDFVLTKDDYTFLRCNTSSIMDNLKKIISKTIEKDIVDKVVVMAPMYKGEIGIDSLNSLLQNLINPDGEEIKVGDTIYRVGDKVLELINMPDENVYNGDIGYIVRIDSQKKNTIYVSFDGNVVKYTPNMFSNIALGYAISIHKSQGSEFDTVILPMTKKYSRMLYKKLIYTAVTRAKRKLIILGEEDAFLLACSNEREILRNSSLKDRLENMYN